ncbi:MAG: zinc-binding dehydrogenase [Candidatus Marinimicrobia bacterium]|nr:zinc-binding dehydrogenase [Candidatus Neomarinimicrobiota bacterium]
MKAVRIHRHGGIDVLKYEDVPVPKINQNQCLIKIKAAALNHLDIWVRKGIPGVPLPMIMGSDGAGVVENIGAKVSEFSVGDRVLIQPLTFCGTCRWCRQNKENYCEQWGIFGENQDGTQCEYMAIDTDHLRIIPDGMSFEEASAFPLVAETAYAMLIDRANIQKGEIIFVWGASSGVGSMAIQIAKALGCKVLTAVGDSKKGDFAEKLGADKSVNYKDDDIIKIVKEFTDKQGVDVIVEHVGTKTWETSLRILGKGGRIVTCGATTGSDAKFDIRRLFYNQQSILGSTMGNVKSFERALDMYRNGDIKPIVDKCFKMAEIRKAHEYLENGKQIGKVIVIPN